MPIRGFDGESHNPPPSIGAWLATCFLVALCYWSVCFYWFGANLLALVLMPAMSHSELLGSILGLAPFLIAAGLTIAFHVPWQGFTRIIVTLLAIQITNSVAFAAAFIGRSVVTGEIKLW